MIPRTVRKLTIAAALTLVTLAGSGPGLAQSISGVADARTDERISLQLQEADLAVVLASFGQIFELETEIDPGVRGEISIELHDVRAGTALTAVCESAGCLWRIADGRLVVERDPEAPPEVLGPRGRAEGPSAAKLEERIDMELEDADLRQVLQAFGSIAAAAVEIDEALEGEVTIQLHETPVREALDALCRTHGCQWELAETDDGPVMRFRPR